MKDTKIDWCDCTLNPVVGCKNGCPYCYARKLNDRFDFIKDWGKPQFFPERLIQLGSKAPKSIFMDSMSDIDYWSYEAIVKTMSAVVDNPQHRYIFLTKAMAEDGKDDMGAIGSIGYIKSLKMLKNVFIGMTVTTCSYPNVNRLELFDFYSIEPILEAIDVARLITENTKLVIIGAETGNRPGKVIPKKAWIETIVRQCDLLNVKVFMKSSLKGIMGEQFRQDKLPWDVSGKLGENKNEKI